MYIGVELAEGADPIPGSEIAIGLYQSYWVVDANYNPYIGVGPIGYFLVSGGGGGHVGMSGWPIDVPYDQYNLLDPEYASTQKVDHARLRSVSKSSGYCSYGQEDIPTIYGVACSPSGIRASCSSFFARIRKGNNHMRATGTVGQWRVQWNIPLFHFHSFHRLNSPYLDKVKSLLHYGFNFSFPFTRIWSQAQIKGWRQKCFYESS
jgi:hypothetical protein